jgi:glycine/D-amino acid oxidase-like deaminating enzyme
MSTQQLDPDTVTQADLRGGTPPWMQAPQRAKRLHLEQDIRCDVAVIGAGITGSLVAEHLASQGYSVCIVDRERPGLGSTAASTAMLLWEIDRSLSELTELYGFEQAATIYKRSLSAVEGLQALIASQRLPCGLRTKPSLYLAAKDIGVTELLAEHALRERAGLPGFYLDHRKLLLEFGIHREAALFSPGAADADPLLLSQSLLLSAIGHGAVLYDGEAKSYDSGTHSTVVVLDSDRVIEADWTVLATGYVMPDFVVSDLHKVTASWAIATPPKQKVWRNEALIWEASSNYNYARTTPEHRIIIGGEDDEEAVEPDVRDALMPAKAEALLGKLSALWPDAPDFAEFSWSGAFGTTSDGLPLIGPVPGLPRVFAAYGYGGNGITFSYLASRIIGACIAGETRPWFDDFAIDRDGPR